MSTLEGECAPVLAATIGLIAAITGSSPCSFFAISRRVLNALAIGMEAVAFPSRESRSLASCPRRL